MDVLLVKDHAIHVQEVAVVVVQDAEVAVLVVQDVQDVQLDAQLHVLEIVRGAQDVETLASQHVEVVVVKHVEVVAEVVHLHVLHHVEVVVPKHAEVVVLGSAMEYVVDAEIAVLVGVLGVQEVVALDVDLLVPQHALDAVTLAE